MNIRNICGAVPLMLLLASQAHAFDSNRIGFQLGIGAGAHSTDIDSSGVTDSGLSTSEQNMALSFSIGYGFTEQFSLFFGGVGGVVNIEGNSYTTTLAGIGTRVYLSSQAPSVFLTGIVGNGVLSEEDQSIDDSPSGSGWLLGIGYEMSERVHIHSSYFQSEVTDPDDSRLKNDISAFHLTVDYLWY